MSSALRVLFLAAEADPFFKVGGLGDVAGSLPPVLRRMGVDIRLVLPLHGGIRLQGYPLQPVCNLQVRSLQGAMPVEVFALEQSELPVYFIAGELIASEAPVYTTDTLVDGLKYTFFSLAALELCRYLDWTPNIVHANDWHTAPAVYSLSTDRKERPFFSSTASVLGVHNLPYLGLGAETALGYFGLPPADAKSLPVWARQLPLPLGLLEADCIVAVSPSYAQEILTPEYGAGLQDLLVQRRSSLTGILNGLDVHAWDPQIDPHLKQNYNLQDLKLRQANKTALQSELGLKADARTALFAMVSRMDFQKGVDLLPEALRRMAERPENARLDWQIVILGAGNLALEAAVRGLEQDFPGRVRAVTRFDGPLSHRIYAGADSLLIPSRYEPCGTTQMIAMRYGCVPVARATGGLRDTVRDIQQGADSTGFLFNAPTPMELANAMLRAMRVYQNEAIWQALQVRGMRRDFSWERSAQEYLRLYQELSYAREKRPVEV
jgi:starch synthase